MIKLWHCSIGYFKAGGTHTHFGEILLMVYHWLFRSSASVYYTGHKPKNKKLWRPGNEAIPQYQIELPC